MQYNGLYQHFGGGNQQQEQSQAQQEYYYQNYYQDQYQYQYQYQYQEQQQQEGDEEPNEGEEQQADDKDEAEAGQDQQLNSTGYASADLRLLSIEYTLFNYLPFNFCGNWVQTSQNNMNACPYDGTYTFSIPYYLPYDDGDITTWFATGWQGYSDLIIYKYGKHSESNEILASCTLHWKTYVTAADEEDGWKTLPSAAQSAIIIVSVAAFMCLSCTYLACCRRRLRRNRHVTDADFATGDEVAPTTTFKMFESKESQQDSQQQRKEDIVHRINLSLKEPDWA